MTSSLFRSVRMSLGLAVRIAVAPVRGFSSKWSAASHVESEGALAGS